MAGSTNNYVSTLPRKQQQSMRLLKNLQPLMVFKQFGDMDVMPLRSGRKAVFRRIAELTQELTAAPDPSIPQGQPLLPTDITVNIIKLQSRINLTKDQSMFGEDDLLNIGRDRILSQMAREADSYYFKRCRAGANALYAGGVASRALVNSAPSVVDFDLAVRALERKNVDRVTNVVGASMKENTEPIEGSYVAICHPDLSGDLTRMEGFIPARKYASAESRFTGEIGATPNGVRLIATTQAPAWAAAGASSPTYLSNGIKPDSAAAADVYPILIFGQHAYGTLSLKDYKSIDLTIIRPGSEKAKTNQDPTGENGCVAADYYLGGSILDEIRMVRLETAATGRWAD